jgi:hypothetical protein
MVTVPMKLRAVLLLAVCTALFASPVQAGAEVRVTFANGRVSIVADNATLSDILREWARVGGSTFTNIEKITASELLTLRIENETELRAIEILLRPIAGYVVAPQRASTMSASAIERVLLMPGNRPLTYPAATASAAAAPAPSFETSQDQMRAGPPKPDDDGPTLQQTPPAPQSAPAQPEQLGQSSPMSNTRLQGGPVRGAITSSRPGVMIGGQSRPGPPLPKPTQPRPGGGGG